MTALEVIGFVAEVIAYGLIVVGGLAITVDVVIEAWRGPRR